MTPQRSRHSLSFVFRHSFGASSFAIVLIMCAAEPALLASTLADVPDNPAQYIRLHYTKKNYRIPMRDGVHLYTIVYSPKDASQPYPMLMTRTPYGIHPYEDDKFRASLGPNPHFLEERYIFVYQDVRGRYMSEGIFENVRPHRSELRGASGVPRGNLELSSPHTDESTDTYDTIDWLLRNVPNHNGKAGLWGISYPGFYSSAGMINAHSALKAVSPQAPIADWFFDDFFHHGAFFLPHAFNFFAGFGQPRPEPTRQRSERFKFGTDDGYAFFMDLGPLKNVNDKHFKNRIAYWNTLAAHPNYDSFWQARNLLPHLRNVAPAVMTVGGWFDAEDLYGALKTYQTIERQNPNIFNVLVMGAWSHGGWSRSEAALGNLSFGANTSAFFQKDIELPFFNHFLKGKGEHHLPEATMFETGLNRWRKFDAWPPRGLEKKAFYLHASDRTGIGRLGIERPEDQDEGGAGQGGAGQAPGHDASRRDASALAAYDSYPSDPRRPVPYTNLPGAGMVAAYMAEDQRFAARRPDVLVYQTGTLAREMTLAGPIQAELYVSTSGTDSDWVVKLVDVQPDGRQILIRSEVLRGRFRNGYEKPEPFVPNQPAKISLELQDVLHTFAKNHRLMVQICSSWFPLVDRNPQKFVPNVFEAVETDFIATTQRVYRSGKYASSVQVGVLPAKN
jgi:putative CocE/NonD family hydrolase